MKSVNIAKFKTELGKYLGFVRKGEEVVVYDRKEPLALVIPFRERKTHELEIEEAMSDSNTLFEINVEPIENINTDSLKFLTVERADR